MMPSIRLRLGLGLALGLLVVMILQWLVVVGAMRTLAEDYARLRLEHDINALLTDLSFDAAGRAQLAPRQPGGIWHTPYSGHYFQIDGAGMPLRSRSLWDQSLPTPKLAQGASALKRIAGPEGQSLLLYSRVFSKQGHVIGVSVAENMTSFETDLAAFKWRYAGLSLAVIALLLMAQALMVRAGLRPLDRVRGQLQRLEQGEIERLDAATPREIRPLVDELNRLLVTLNQRLTRSRRALGNLAHAIKTPLTVLTNLASHDDVRAHAELRQTLTDQTTAIQRLLERELKHARLAGAAVGGQRFVLSAELPALVQTLHAIHRDRSLRIDTHYAPTLVLKAEREDMLELFGNLLDNACKWARGALRLSVDDTTDIHIAVEDDGPGCPPELCSQLTRRGLRLDETADGHGLGLAIAHDIVTSYQGHIEFDRSPELEGLRVRVTLPASGAPGD
jgi:signal transduction histidine kinase